MVRHGAFGDNDALGKLMSQWETTWTSSKTGKSLPETPKLPSVPTFAVGKISGTRQTWCLPSVPKTTLDKDTTHGITVYARQRDSLPSVFFLHSAKKISKHILKQ